MRHCPALDLINEHLNKITKDQKVLTISIWSRFKLLPFNARDLQEYLLTDRVYDHVTTLPYVVRGALNVICPTTMFLLSFFHIFFKLYCIILNQLLFLIILWLIILLLGCIVLCQ